MKILLLFYDLLLIFLLPFYLVYLFFKRKFSWQVLQRLKGVDNNFLKTTKGKELIWIHAVSLGEVSTCKSLIAQLSLAYPNKIILITTITTTGRTLAQSLLKENVVSLFMPFDLSFLISRFIQKINPKLLVLLETELWPNLLYYAQKYNIPVVILNARLSDRSFGKYRMFSWFMRAISKNIRLFCAQSEIDKERFIQLGITAQRVKTTGNMKFDAIEELDPKQIKELSDLRNKLFLAEGDFLIVAGSTHEKEEEYILEIFSKLKQYFRAKNTKFNNLRLLIAPRHLERIDSIEQLIDKMKFISRRVSDSEVISKDSILLLDTIGQLRLIYSLADFVFVGGSLVPVGGHNILEPAFFQKPIIVGPYTHNFRAVIQLFLSNHALIQVKDNKELELKMQEFISDAVKLRKLGESAKAVLASQQGATLANLEIMKKFL